MLAFLSKIAIVVSWPLVPMEDTDHTCYSSSFFLLLRNMCMKAIWFMIMLLSSLHLVSCACHIAVLSKADSCDVRCKGFGLRSSQLGQIKCFADKNPGFGESKNSNKKCKVFNPETLYAGKTILLVYAEENICAMQKKIIFTSSKRH